jgi:tRNA (guanine-N7-)-methyltransferase
MTERPEQAPGRRRILYGRRRGRKLHRGQQGLVDTLLPRLAVTLPETGTLDPATLFAPPVSDVWLEIGFGGGEHLLHRAIETPTVGFIGVEPFVNGMAKMMMAVRARPLANLRVYDDDATRLLDWLPPASLDGIDLLYPDPWPKKKHWKRRFVSPVNLDRFARVLKPGSKFRFASDIDTYVNWTLLHCRAHGAFAWQAAEAADWHRPYDGWPGTRYEAKAIREGRPPAYLTFIRI